MTQTIYKVLKKRHKQEAVLILYFLKSIKINSGGEDLIQTFEQKSKKIRIEIGKQCYMFLRKQPTQGAQCGNKQEF